MTISFKFSVFELEIDHKVLQELGKFTIFCMKAISSNLTIENISNVIQINENIIKKQLSFAISRGYMTDDFILTNKGVETVKLFEFVNVFNHNKIQIALEHYIENDYKKIYSVNNAELEDISTGYKVKDNFYDYKVSNKFDEILENDKKFIKEILIENFEKYKDIIEKYLDDFMFKISKLEKEKFYNYTIDDIDFIDSLINHKDKEFEYISIKIPIIEINKTIQSDIVPKEHIELLQQLFDEYKFLDLIIGEPITFNKNQKEKFEPNIYIEPILSEIDILKNNLLNKEIWFNVFLFTNISTKIKKYSIIKYLNISRIMDKI